MRIWLMVTLLAGLMSTGITIVDAADEQRQAYDRMVEESVKEADEFVEHNRLQKNRPRNNGRLNKRQRKRPGWKNPSKRKKPATEPTYAQDRVTLSRLSRRCRCLQVPIHQAIADQRQRSCRRVLRPIDRLG
jgi:rhamnose utilization protein RhaD (predicted bifunctional aldolase and dehydrogenase)